MNRPYTLHLVGGPADGQKHLVRECTGSFRVAEAPELDRWKPGDMVADRVIATVHTYVIRQVGRHCVVGIHESIA
ncbi:hypothetical protein [uncultured Xanthomonas sp.]|uniref:hypothetical protein n=1 Tax=uncultured Xanthomonas sp. TaxID=152831 RepID=UPI0025EDFED3|nr:hypothetical protein [uncultured Xanthomonas sp.]